MAASSPVERVAPLPRAVEAFARDLLQLVRGVRIYPPGHPFMKIASERLLSGAPWGAGGRIALGVARSELLIEGEFVGGRGSKAAELAAVLTGRGVGRVTVTRGASQRELLTLAELLSSRTLNGTELGQELSSRGAVSIAVEPLDLERIHSAAAWGAAAEGLSDESQRRQAWVWLHATEVSVEEVAQHLVSDEFWDVVATGDGIDARACALLLAGLGDRLEQALGLLSDERRSAVLAKVSGIGASLTPSDLADYVAADPAGTRLRSLGASALLGDLDPERFVDLLANLTALGDHGSRRLAAVFRRFAPQGGARGALDLVRSRLLGGGGQRFAVEVWKSVEEFLLKLEEDPFMAQDYAEILEAADDDEGPPYEGRDEDLSEDLGRHLDGVFVGIAADGGRVWRERLLSHLEKLLKEEGAPRAVTFANAADEALPGVLGDRPALVREIFRRGMSEAREARRRDLQEFIRFCRAHETLVLDVALKALEEEQRTASRRLLVEILSGCSPSATPALVSRARAGPWFVTRNLVIVLGRQGDARAAPVLRECLSHRHPKVRREAQRVVGPGVPSGSRRDGGP